MRGSLTTLPCFVLAYTVDGARRPASCVFAQAVAKDGLSFTGSPWLDKTGVEVAEMYGPALLHGEEGDVFQDGVRYSARNDYAPWIDKA